MRSISALEANPKAAQGSATQQVIDHVHHSIRSGKLQPGQRVRERELAVACSVSRTAIREALTRLVAEGTLVREHGHSATVRKFTLAEVWAQHQIREALEGLAAGLSAARPDQSRYYSQLRDLKRTMQHHADRADAEGYLKTNSKFHALIADMSGNPFIQDHLDRTNVTQLRMQAGRFMGEQGLEQSNADHQRILDAILDGDAQAAEAAMRAHVRSTRRWFLEMPDDAFE